jgi:hypothetical protein
MDHPAVKTVQILNDRNCVSRVDSARTVLAGDSPQGFAGTDHMLDCLHGHVGVGGTVDKEEDQRQSKQ